MAGLNRSPYFACRGAMHKLIQHLSSHCESTWTLCTQTRTNAHWPYVYRHRRFEQEVEEVRLQRALTGSPNTGLMPSSPLCAKGGGGGCGQFCEGFLPHHGGGQSRPGPVHSHSQTRTGANGCNHMHHGALIHNVSACMPCPRATGMRHMLTALPVGSDMLRQRPPHASVCGP